MSFILIFAESYQVKSVLFFASIVNELNESQSSTLCKAVSKKHPLSAKVLQLTQAECTIACIDLLARLTNLSLNTDIMQTAYERGS